MRIGLVSTLSTPVRAEGAGSVESIVFGLAHGLERLGHEVTVFATGDSSPPGELVAALPGPYGRRGSPDDWQICEWLNVCRAVEVSYRFDVLHSHSYLNAVPLTRLTGCPVLNTTHVLPHDSDVGLLASVPGAAVSAVSHTQWSAHPGVALTAVVPHGIDAAAHTFRARSDGYLCFLGRFAADKGPLEAIETARQLDMPLRMAGPRNEYYNEVVARHVDGRRVEFLGPIGGAARDEMLGGAAALLYPLRYPEPFGLVMVEAMMSGTPVAAYRVGAVPEIVDPGVSGAVAAPGEGLREPVRRCLGLDRRAIRQRAEERFDSERMVAGYEHAYRRILTPERTGA